MTIIERLQHDLPNRQGGTVLVFTADLAALLECVRAQHEWIERWRNHVGAESLTGYIESRTKLKIAVDDAQKKVGLVK